LTEPPALASLAAIIAVAESDGWDVENWICPAA
jgi:hypothetical protein